MDTLTATQMSWLIMSKLLLQTDVTNKCGGAFSALVS